MKTPREFGVTFARIYEPGSENASATVAWLATACAELRDTEWAERTKLASGYLCAIAACTSRADSGGCEECQEHARAALAALEGK